MTTFVTFDRNPGPKRVDSSSAPVCVILALPSLEVSLPYDDLDTLDETILLFQEARAKLTASLGEALEQNAVDAESYGPGADLPTRDAVQ